MQTTPSPFPLKSDQYGLLVPKDVQCSETYAKTNNFPIFLNIFA